MKDADGFFTSHNHEALIHRRKPVNNNATPSDNEDVAKLTLQIVILRSRGSEHLE